MATLTKIVDGKPLPKEKFAYVGDESDISTWHLPIDDDHVESAVKMFAHEAHVPEGEKAAVARKTAAKAKKKGVDVDSPGRLPGGPKFSPEEHSANATKLLTLLLCAALMVCFAAQIVVTWNFIHDKQALDEFNRVFNSWIRVLSRLFGSAVIFYFTRRRK